MREETRVATRIGPAKQDGGSKVGADTICYSAAISACEMRHEWQLTLGLLRRMAEANVEANIISYNVTI